MKRDIDFLWVGAVSDHQLPFNLARIVHRVMTDSRGWRVDSLMSELGIKDRTYRKYRKVLIEQFQPFKNGNGASNLREVADGEAKYLRLVFGDEVKLHDSTFVSRVAALHYSQQLLGFVGQTTIGLASNELLVDFRARVKEKRSFLDEVLSNVDRMFFQLPDAPKDYGKKEDVIRALLDCLMFRRAIKINYTSANFADLTVELEPYTLAVHRSALYLIGRGADSDVRIYAVDRILSVEKLGRKFVYPRRSEYDPVQYTEGSFGIFRSDSKTLIDFELVFDNERWLRLYVSERRWHPTQVLEDLEDGRLKLTFSVNTDVEVWPWIRQFGERVEVVRPA